MKSSYQIITLQIAPYNWEVEAREINKIKESSILPELWDSHQITVHAIFVGNSQSCNYSGGLEVEVESRGWDEVLEDGDRETLLTIIKHHMATHPSQQGYHIMTLWEWGLDERDGGIDGDEPYTWWRCLGVVDDALLPLTLDPSYEINVLPETTHQQPITSGKASLYLPIDDVTELDIHRQVRYIPGHANGNPDHPDCEDGIVTSFNQQSVFVRFKSKVNPNEYQIHPQRCDRADLIWLP